MPNDTTNILTAARAAAARYRASATGSAYRADHDTIAAALAEVDRLTARVAELERERAGDVAGIVGWLRKAAARRAKAADDRGNTGSGMTAAIQYAELAIAADAIERGDWREGVERG